MVSAVVAIGAAVVGGVAKSKAAKKAAKAATKGQQAALSASQQAATSATGDINRLFGAADVSRQGGFTQALDFLSGAPAQQIAPFQQGNVAAQQTLLAGLPQFQQAILGQPTDLSGLQAQQFGQPSDFNIDIPAARPAQPSAGQPQPSQDFSQGSPGGLFGGFDRRQFRGSGRF